MMQIRLSQALGIPVVEEGTTEALGRIDWPVLNPDTGKVEGFWIKGFLGGPAFLLSQDILRWGMRVAVRDMDSLCDPRDIVRLDSLLASNRPIIGQTIKTEGGAVLGRCKDVQFDTTHFQLSWIFPRRFFRWGISIAANQIVEVTPEAIMVRDLVVPTQVEETEEKTIPQILPSMPDAS